MTIKPHFLRALPAILVMAGGGVALDAWADSHPSVDANLYCYHYDTGIGGIVYDFNKGVVTNPEFNIRDSFRLVGYFNNLVDGAFGYYDLERNFDGTNVSFVMRVADAHINAPFVNNFNAMSGGGEELQIIEDMMMVYFPSSMTDLPPTQVSFQISCSVQGQSFNQLQDYTGNYAFGVVNVQTGAATNLTSFLYANYASNGVGSGVLTPVSVQLLSPAFTNIYANSPFQLNWALEGTDSGWASDQHYTDPNQPATVDLRLVLNGIVNVVDQNNQPIPPGKVVFYYVNPRALNDPAQRIAIPNPANLAGVPSVSLSAVAGTNSLVIQWPSYATNYQLETTTNLVNSSWITNSLPTPVQSGPFLQVTVPSTNTGAFFRLIQTN